ncbi:MAG: 50S ribosomal protein L7/L12 [Chloroflexota bacterium]|nr:MAG: 50S ribosomal protein L7/L12 [Chloroflexota bacterium]
MANVEKILDQLNELTVLEMAELVKKAEELWGVSAAAPVAVAAAAGPAAAAAAEPEEEKTEFDVVIKDAGPKKIEVIKAIRQMTSLGLKEAKELAETPDAKVLEAVGKEAASDAKSKLEAAGATVEVA